MPKLTLKQERFVVEYLKSGNATEAAHLAGYSNSSRNTLGQQAFENLRNPKIQDAIEQALVDAEITPEWILLRLKDEATSKTNHGSERIKALENLAKYKQLTGFSDTPKNLFTGDITISFGKPQTPALPSETVIDI